MVLPSTSDPLARALRAKAAAGAPGVNDARVVACGSGWQVIDVVCTAGPSDRPYEEQQPFASASLVLSGTFVYRSERGGSLLSTGSTLLVNAERSFECSHDHGEGDRCLSFQVELETLDSIARDAGVRRARFEHDRLPPLRALAPIATRAEAAVAEPAALEELAYELIGTALRLTGTLPKSHSLPPLRQTGRVSQVLRYMEEHSSEPLSLTDLATKAGVSPYHFLRCFKAATGVTPRQWLIRARLRDAARRLVITRAAITEIALDVGFEDLSNFIRTFHAEFGLPPRDYRRRRLNSPALAE